MSGAGGHAPLPVRPYLSQLARQKVVHDRVQRNTLAMLVKNAACGSNRDKCNSLVITAGVGVGDAGGLVVSANQLGHFCRDI
jgi:hypothetical protein